MASIWPSEGSASAGPSFCPGAETPGLEAGQYDAILLAEVDHYFKDPAEWLKTASEALKPNGKLVISNRIHHRTKSMAAAKKAGLELESESTPVQTHFIAVFVVPKGGLEERQARTRKEPLR